MDQTVVAVNGMDELADDFRQLAEQYPDKAGDLLRKDAVKLRKEVTDEVKELTGTNGSSKRSLAKAGSYRVSQVQGIGMVQYVEISAKAPHFHLVEHGHVRKAHKKQGGQVLGFVPGKHMMDRAVRKHRQEMPAAVSAMVDELLKERGLT